MEKDFGGKNREMTSPMSQSQNLQKENMEGKRRMKRFGNYKVGKILGSGGFGVVYQATHIRTNFKVAMKATRIMTKSEDQALDIDNAFQLKSLHRETYLLANLKHPNIGNGRHQLHINKIDPLGGAPEVLID